ncbi:MAG: Xaa-Pro peptidase family protein [candidate division WOR-3 bacterium]|nr:Xaa-Pro peptidase family protein [candidate division WOR-3 bacterium]MCX7947259.1 Xaa-Pro peptidase family protein [candidate division WOR-3 bacterium]MDW8150184.1 Xaa-Pro peptidase family protein [candidate division WOR-3 bacterium]
MLSYLRNYLIENNLEAILITNLSNIRYLTGFKGSNAQVLITLEKNYFLTDFRYKTYANEKIDKQEFEIVIYDQYYDILKEILKDIKNLAIEENYTTLNAYSQLKKNLPQLSLISVSNVVEKLRAIKTNEEIEKIKKACSIAKELFEIILNFIKPEVMRERDIAIEMEYIARKYLNAEDMAFETIVLSKERSAMPHGRASNRTILNNAPLLIDFGIVYDGYCCDITRTIWIGNRVDHDFINTYDIVKNAIFLAEDVAKVGMKNVDLDKVVREFLKSYGYDNKYFGHALGHSIGIEVHEFPVFSQKAEEYVLQGNEVFTIEPGVYIENKFGIRIEDSVVLNKENNKISVLSDITKELIKL